MLLGRVDKGARLASNIFVVHGASPICNQIFFYIILLLCMSLMKTGNLFSGLWFYAFSLFATYSVGHKFFL